MIRTLCKARSLFRLLPILLVILAAVFALAPHPALAASGASFTSVDPPVDGAGTCLAGSATNCNSYDAKNHVWMNGGPLTAGLQDGAYFFAVVQPSGQANPNDGSPDLLSTGPYTDRTFTITDGVMAYGGTHDLDSGPADGPAGIRPNSPDGKGPLIRLAPYKDTSNPGGIYIMAVCTLPLSGLQPVAASNCKYDAFKIGGASGAGFDLIVTKDATPSFTRTYSWNITKALDSAESAEQDIASGASATFNYTVTANETGFTDSAWQVTGAVNVVNPNAVDVSGLGFTDQISYNGGTPDPNASCSFDNPPPVSIAANAAISLNYTCTYGGMAPASTAETNTAAVAWDNSVLTAPHTTASGTADFAFTTPTNPVNQTITVTDTFNGGTPTTLGMLTATDDLQNLASVSFPDQAIVSGVAGTCTDYTNTATFTATDDAQVTGSADKTVTVCVGTDLTVTKTAIPSFTRTYNWNITKNVDKTLVEQIGGTATFNYTVTAGETGFVDSAWAVNGTITVTNPNDWEDISLTSVADTIDNGGQCSITSGDPAGSVPAGSFVTLDYTCTFAGNPGSGTNTATATWDSTAAFTPDGSAQGTAPYAFGAPTSTVNQTITVTDTFNGGTTTTLGTLTATDSSPFASQIFSYPRTVNVPTNNCVSYANTASTGLTGQGQSDGKTVEVCGPAKTGALTMGYWQNKNGQGIISGQAKTGVCPSAGRLRLYAPFQDLSSTAPCTAVATYVYNVIKAATCSGTTCNAMLKAQMLATALDVYFSDPALGGNKIGAPAPIGGVTIDLTTICKMIDGSGGTAICGGSYENVSSAFGGASSLTVSQMLIYAASQSNAGGTTWYGNVKATQVLAKDAFDAINNQVAFAP